MELNAYVMQKKAQCFKQITCSDQGQVRSQVLMECAMPADGVTGTCFSLCLII